MNKKGKNAALLLGVFNLKEKCSPLYFAIEKYSGLFLFTKFS